jgi:hypothetical protein
MLEIRLAGVHVLGTAVAYGQAAEAESIDDICFGDTQNIAAHPFRWPLPNGGSYRPAKC